MKNTTTTTKPATFTTPVIAHVVYAVTESKGKTFWTRVGRAVVATGGETLRITLDAAVAPGTPLEVRPATPRG